MSNIVVAGFGNLFDYLFNIYRNFIFYSIIYYIIFNKGELMGNYSSENNISENSILKKDMFPYKSLFEMINDGDKIYLWEFFVYYNFSHQEKEKQAILQLFLKLMFNKKSKLFTFNRNNKIIFEDYYEKDFDISHDKKILFIKWCVKKMFENYLDEEEYEKKSFEKGLKRVLEINDKSLYDQDVENNRLEDYFSRTVFFELCNNNYKFNNPHYFQCQECGGFFLKSKNKKITNQKYCIDCKIIVSKRQSRNRSKKYYHATKKRKL